MKFLVFTDTHGDPDITAELRDKSRHVHAAICAGDFTNFGENIVEELERLERFHCPVYLVHGNHESRDTQNIRNFTLTSDNVHFFHRDIISVGKYSLVGYGGLGFSFEAPDFEEFIKEQKPGARCILVTHQPPHSTELDKKNGRHTGNNSFTKFIDSHHPVLVVSGHIHECEDTVEERGETTLINPGPKGMVLTL